VTVGSMLPEIQLLLLCASPVETEERAARIQELMDGNLDSSVLQERADSYRLMPLLYWELKSRRPDNTPQWLANQFEQNLRRNLFLTSELFRILDFFERESIAAIPFKGPTLAVTAYSNLALRRFDDLDILVSPEDVWHAM
jgi:Uncharacterised nucleotidyltransferase